MTEWHLYMIRARDGSLYTGIATDVERRFAEHRGGDKGAKYLRGRAPLEMVYQCPIGSRSLALKVERRLKAASKTDKEAIVGAAMTRLELLGNLFPGLDF